MGRVLAEGRRKSGEAENGHADCEDTEGKGRDDGDLFGKGELKVADDEDGEGHDDDVDEDVEGADCVPEGDLKRGKC